MRIESKKEAGTRVNLVFVCDNCGSKEALFLSQYEYSNAHERAQILKRFKRCFRCKAWEGTHGKPQPA